MQVRCPHCSHEFNVPYWQLGMNTSCPACHQDVRLSMVNVLSLEDSGWSITFWEFTRLAGEPTYDADIQPLLATFGYERVQIQPLRFRDASDKSLIAEEVHTQIQSEETQQYRLYQAALTLWR